MDIINQNHFYCNVYKLLIPQDYIRLLNKSSSASGAEWSYAQACGEKVLGSNPAGSVNFHIEFFAFYPYLTAR